MDLKRAIWTGVLLWVLIFFEVSVLMFGIGLEGVGYAIAHHIILLGLVTVAAIIYFGPKKIRADLGEGLLLGVIYIIVGVILDLVITVPLFVKDYSVFFNTALMIGLVETIVVAGLIGAIRK